MSTRGWDLRTLTSWSNPPWGRRQQHLSEGRSSNSTTSAAAGAATAAARRRQQKQQLARVSSSSSRSSSPSLAAAHRRHQASRRQRQQLVVAAAKEKRGEKRWEPGDGVEASPVSGGRRRRWCGSKPWRPSLLIDPDGRGGIGSRLGVNEQRKTV